MRPPLYLDNAASTPLDLAVLAKMTDVAQYCGNPSARFSEHGQVLQTLIDESAEHVAKAICAHPREIVWTSGATESINLVLQGFAPYHPTRPHILTLATEHKATLDCLEAMKTPSTVVKPLPNGQVDFDALEAALTRETGLLSISPVNNETGVIQPLDAITAFCEKHAIKLHFDCAQVIGKFKIDLSQTPADYVSLSSHKAHGPAGIGALVLRRKPRARLAPLFYGGGQQNGIRPGTLPVMLIVGMGEAYRLASENFDDHYAHVDACKKTFLEGLATIHRFHLNAKENTIPHIVNVCFDELENPEAFIEKIYKGITCSQGSACNSTAITPSHVLLSMGISEEDIRRSVRFSFSRMTTVGDVEAGFQATDF